MSAKRGWSIGRKVAAAVVAGVGIGVGVLVAVQSIGTREALYEDARYNKTAFAEILATNISGGVRWSKGAVVEAAYKGFAEREGLAVGLYGGGGPVLERLQQRLAERFPKLRIPFAWAPPFRALDAEEDARVSEAITSSGVDVLFVGLGCPKQERWMAAHREALPCVQLGVGAAFDFLAGAKRQAPAWIQNAGLEWLFRLACEPRRLWRRYLVHNPRFVAGLSWQLLSSRLSSRAMKSAT